MKRNTLKSAGVIVSGLLIAAAAAGTFALWNDQSTVSGGEIYSGNLDLNVTNASWEDVSLKDGSKGSQESLDKVTASGPITDISDFRIVPGDTVIGTYDISVALEGEHALADLLVDFDNNPTIPEGFEIDYRMNSGDWTNINTDGSILFYSPDFIDDVPPNSIPANNLAIDGDETVDVEIELRVYFDNESVGSMQSDVSISDIDFTLSQVRAVLPEEIASTDLTYVADPQESTLEYIVDWVPSTDPSVTGYRVVLDEYSVIPETGQLGIIESTIFMSEGNEILLGTTNKTVSEDKTSTTISSSYPTTVKYARVKVTPINIFGEGKFKQKEIEVNLPPAPVETSSLRSQVNLGKIEYVVDWTDSPNNTASSYKIKLTGIKDGQVVFDIEKTSPAGATTITIPKTGTTACDTIIATVVAVNVGGESSPVTSNSISGITISDSVTNVSGVTKVINKDLLTAGNNNKVHYNVWWTPPTSNQPIDYYRVTITGHSSNHSVIGTRTLDFPSSSSNVIIESPWSPAPLANPSVSYVRARVVAVNEAGDSPIAEGTFNDNLRVESVSLKHPISYDKFGTSHSNGLVSTYAGTLNSTSSTGVYNSVRLAGLDKNGNIIYDMLPIYVGKSATTATYAGVSVTTTNSYETFSFYTKLDTYTTVKRVMFVHYVTAANGGVSAEIRGAVVDNPYYNPNA